ncbi:MAG: hypothetical protein H0X29_09695, partial [Parachlamydiaceae bacterium]|nr:hypothetical protein [Parachlamydiaceae bacterium]
MTTTSYAEEELQRPTEQQVNQLKRQLAEAQIENGRNRQRLEKLSLIVLEREKKIAQLQHYELNFRKFNNQKNSVGTSENATLEQLRKLQSDKERLTKELEDSHQHAIQLDRVIHFLRERQEESQLEINQFHDEFHKAQTVVAECNEKLHHVGHGQKELEDVVLQEREAKEEALEEIKALYSQFEALKKMLGEVQQQLEISQAERSTTEAEQEKLKHEEISKAYASQAETEVHLKMAQQHLAKKVKEVSDLQDKGHSQDLLIKELQSNLEQTRMLMSEQHRSFETQLQQEKKHQEQLWESAKTAESLVSKWEEKYFNINEKWQNNEVQLKEMKKIEAKHSQLQVLLANIGGFFGTPMTYPTQISEEKISIPEENPKLINQSSHPLEIS